MVNYNIWIKRYTLGFLRKNVKKQICLFFFLVQRTQLIYIWCTRFVWSAPHLYSLCRVNHLEHCWKPIMNSFKHCWHCSLLNNPKHKGCHHEFLEWPCHFPRIYYYYIPNYISKMSHHQKHQSNKDIKIYKIWTFLKMHCEVNVNLR